MVNRLSTGTNYVLHFLKRHRSHRLTKESLGARIKKRNSQVNRFRGEGGGGCLFLSAFVGEGEGREEWRGPDGLDVRRSTLDARGSGLGARRSALAL